jgi:hypothetical protein
LLIAYQLRYLFVRESLGFIDVPLNIFHLSYIRRPIPYCFTVLSIITRLINILIASAAQKLSLSLFKGFFFIEFYLLLKLALGVYMIGIPD